MPFFGAFGVANPLGMLCPELGARITANVAVAQDPAGNLDSARISSTSGSMPSLPAIIAIGRGMVAQQKLQPSYSLFFV